MTRGFLLRIFACLLIFAFCLYRYIDRNNHITELRYQLPALADEILVMNEKNASLQFDIERSESPLRLMELARESEFAHLHHPRTSDIWTIPAETES